MRLDVTEDRRRRSAEPKDISAATADSAMVESEQLTHAGETIPIPMRGDFVSDLAKATRRKKPSS